MKRVQTFSFDDVYGEIYYVNCITFKLHGVYMGELPIKISIWGANPAEIRASFTGSGLPYPNAEIAYDNTPNHYEVNISETNNSFDLYFYYPNGYYTQQGQIYIPPHLKMIITDSSEKKLTRLIYLKYDIPSRSLTKSLYPIAK